MATTNYNWNLPTVGGSEDTWGTQLNANWSALDTLLGGVTALEFSYLEGLSSNLQAQLNSKQAADADLTALAALTPLDGRFIVGNGTTWVAESGSTALASLGITATATEINYLSGATGNIQTQINNIVSSGGANDSTVTISASSGLSGGGSFTLNQATNATISVAHADTSSQSSVNNSGLTFIQDITLDTYGHVTGIGSATVTIPVPDALSTASGSAPSYSARAWVNFNGTGTVAIRASGNISSITDTGLGRYTMNFATSLPDANYAVSFGASLSGSASSVAYPIMELISQSTSNFQVIMGNRGSVDIDPLICTFMVMR